MAKEEGDEEEKTYVDMRMARKRGQFGMPALQNELEDLNIYTLREFYTEISNLATSWSTAIVCSRSVILAWPVWRSQMSPGT